MSWMKRRAQTTPSPAPPPPSVPVYNPNQHSAPDWQQQNAGHNWYNQSQQNEINQHPPSNYWQPQYQQQQQHQHQPPYNQYQNQYNQQTAQPGYYQQNVRYDQNYSNGQQYGFTPQNNVYTQQQQQQHQQQQQPPPNSEGDSWNWGWGDEDNSNVQLTAAQNNGSNANSLPSNSVADSFTNDETWKWQHQGESTNSSALTTQELTSTSTSSLGTESKSDSKETDELFPKMGDLVKKHSENTQFQVKQDASIAENYETISLNQLPPMPTGNRIKKEHLTPQWSIESQMSQESSDDILQTSESDKSHMFSRSSTISHSPVSGQQTPLEPPNPQYVEHHALKTENDFEPFNQENKEILSKIKEDLPTKNDPSPPPMKNVTPPPSGLSNTKNPYKRSNLGFSHKAISRTRASTSDTKSYYAPFPTPFNQTVNLETVPDNSEHPDVIPAPIPNAPVKSISTSQCPDNNEVAPINDRNQYLETGQLSDENTNQTQEDNVDTLPPPGLSRMVLGQIQQTESISQENQVDSEPPPGLSRMVLGQTETSVGGIQTNSPPVGLHRMVPGESSSPETGSRYPNICLEDDYVSETELNQINQITSQSRSATIGADTPPADIPQTDRSETIGANGGAIPRDTVLDGANLLDVGVDRRDSIEGQPQTSDIDNLVSSVRDLAVGENATDTSKATTESRRHETTDSEGERQRERGKSPRDRRRYKDDRREKDKNRERYSPDYVREKKGERRRYRDRYYDDDTDYFSDKERDGRRDERDRREEYDRKYNSLRKDKDKDRRRRDGRDGRDRDVREGRERDVREGRERDVREGRERDVREGRERDVREGRERDVREGRERDVRDGREYRDGRRDYYYNRYEDDFDGISRSRPSSRSDSMHDSYRERGQDRRHRDKDREHRRHRDVYNPYMQGYGGYDPYNPYYQQYQYLENLRRSNPQAYAEWYRKYYNQSGQQPPFSSEDKTSVHSGRSSTNDDLAKERYLRQSYYGQSDTISHMSGYYRADQSVISSHYGMDDSSISRPFDYTDTSLQYEDNTTSQRLTPAKFSTSHPKASISFGRILKILPYYPMEGQAAVVEIGQMQDSLRGDSELKELMEFPGPLIKGVTHKKTIIEYCENKIKEHTYNSEISDPDSYVLMWELLILLLRQNGMVVGTDIAELLMKDRKYDHSLRPSSVASNSSGVVDGVEGSAVAGEGVNVSSANSALKEEYVTNKFREYLLYGSGKEALEWAMKNSLWGHALFLASKLDKRTYANVMMRFANGLPMNDPLQTLYQLLSGRLPASVTSVCDEKWGDWRPHLAMILSNTTQRPELDRKAITTLADTLMLRGSIYAAQFCYLMAEVGFSRYGTQGAKLVLLGGNHSKPFRQFSTNEAIHMTEVYEYACSLNDSAFVIPEFQAYKYLIATRLADRGYLESALSYLEQISGVILQNPAVMQPSLIHKVCELADRLKYFDPVVDFDENDGNEDDDDGDMDTSRPGNTWLRDLKQIQQEYNMGLITHESISNLNVPTPDMDSLQNQSSYDQTPQDPWQSQQQFIEQQYQQTSQPTWQPEQLQEQTSGDFNKQDNQEVYNNQYQEQQQQSWNPPQQWGDNQAVDAYSLQNQEQLHSGQLQQHDYWQNSQAEDSPRPQISMPNQRKPSYGDADPLNKQKESPIKSKQPTLKEEKATAGTGWFGGIFSRLALRPRNQMKLPDDKNPSIVWDQEKKRWVNLEEDGNEASSEVKPPPKMSDMPPKSTMPPQNQQFQSAGTPKHQFPIAGVQNMPQNGNTFSAPLAVATAVGGDSAPLPPTQPNMFKMQRNRNLKKSYVDVFNPSGKTGGSAPNLLPNSESFAPPAPSGTQMNFFVPAPVADANAPIDFLTPMSTMPMNEQPAHHS